MNVRVMRSNDLEMKLINRLTRWHSASRSSRSSSSPSLLHVKWNTLRMLVCSLLEAEQTTITGSRSRGRGHATSRNLHNYRAYNSVYNKLQQFDAAPARPV